MILALSFTLDAALYDKSDNNSDVPAYLMLYCGAFLPPIAWNVIIKFSLRNHERESRFLDVFQITFTAVVLLTLLVMGSSHDIWMMIPWALIIPLDIALISLHRLRSSKAEN